MKTERIAAIEILHLFGKIAGESVVNDNNCNSKDKGNPGEFYIKGYGKTFNTSNYDRTYFTLLTLISIIATECPFQIIIITYLTQCNRFVDIFLATSFKVRTRNGIENVFAFKCIVSISADYSIIVSIDYKQSDSNKYNL